jgi:uncharacterized protein (TIGR02266 family)
MSLDFDKKKLPAERRQHLRAGINWPVRIETDQGSFKGVALNISSGGAFIHCPDALEIADVFRMDIYPHRSNRTLTVSADVVWSNTSGTAEHQMPLGLGVRFVDISDADQELISNMVLDYLKSAKESDFTETEEISIIDLAEVE